MQHHSTVCSGITECQRRPEVFDVHERVTGSDLDPGTGRQWHMRVSRLRTGNKAVGKSWLTLMEAREALCKELWPRPATAASQSVATSSEALSAQHPAAGEFQSRHRRRPSC